MAATKSDTPQTEMGGRFPFPFVSPTSGNPAVKEASSPDGHGLGLLFKRRKCAREVGQCCVDSDGIGRQGSRGDSLSDQGRGKNLGDRADFEGRMLVNLIRCAAVVEAFISVMFEDCLAVERDPPRKKRLPGRDGRRCRQKYRRSGQGRNQAGRRKLSDRWTRSKARESRILRGKTAS